MFLVDVIQEIARIANFLFFAKFPSLFILNINNYNRCSTLPSFYDAFPGELIPAVAVKLKDLPEIQPPEGVKFWKTGIGKDFPPVDWKNFWYIRCASLLRKLAKYGDTGVNRMRKQYSTSKRYGMAPRHSSKGSGAIIRRCMQQLEKCHLVEKTESKGRQITSQGKGLLDRIASQITRAKTAG